MPTVAEIRATVEQRMRALLRELQQRQFLYRAMNGRYWQGVRTHSVPPADGVAAAPDLTVKPSDQDEDWTAMQIPLAALPATLECAFQVDTYASPQGDGWVLRATVQLNGQVWQKTAVGHGPDSSRATGWVRLS